MQAASSSSGTSPRPEEPLRVRRWGAAADPRPPKRPRPTSRSRRRTTGTTARSSPSKEVIGFYLTSHPLSEFSEQLQAFTQNQVKDLRDIGDGKDVLIGGTGLVDQEGGHQKPSRNGHSKYINFDLEDPTGVVRCIQWPDDFARKETESSPKRSCSSGAGWTSAAREPTSS